jgi:hypothetical protein
VDKKRKPEPDDKEQSARFVDAAKKIGADRNGLAFQEAIKRIALPRKRARIQTRSSGDK